MIYIEKSKQVSEVFVLHLQGLFCFLNIDGDFEDSSSRLQILSLQNVSFT
jgi:hypothetical protein